MTTTRPEWYLDELAHAGPEHLDADYVAGYERKASYDPTGDVDELTRHGIGADSLVVDLGAGTGVFAVAAARRFGTIVAVDVSAPMAAALERRVAAGGLANLAVVHGGYLTYEHVRTEHSTYRWLFEPLLERVGFEILDVEYVRGVYGAYTLRRA